MDKVTSIEQLLDGVSSVRNLKKGFVTNFFLDYDKHNLWILKGDCFAERIGNTFFVVKKGEGFWNVFYNTTDLGCLRQDLTSFKSKSGEKSIVIDVVGRLGQNVEIANCFQQLGFNNICNLSRMSRPTPQVDFLEDFDKVKVATSVHAEQIQELLQKYFDKELEQLPYLEEIIEIIELKHVLIYLDGDKVVGFVIFEKNKTTLYLRYWFVCPEYRDKHIGGLLLKRFFYEGNDTKRQMLWVVKTNENSVKRYVHYGFNEDNLEDSIYLYGDFAPNKLTTNQLNRGG